MNTNQAIKEGYRLVHIVGTFKETLAPIRFNAEFVAFSLFCFDRLI